jgi:hypothetical protein
MAKAIKTQAAALDAATAKAKAENASLCRPIMDARADEIRRTTDKKDGEFRKACYRFNDARAWRFIPEFTRINPEGKQEDFVAWFYKTTNDKAYEVARQRWQYLVRTGRTLENGVTKDKTTKAQGFTEEGATKAVKRIVRSRLPYAVLAALSNALRDAAMKAKDAPAAVRAKAKAKAKAPAATVPTTETPATTEAAA